MEDWYESRHLSPIERIKKRITIDENGCWNWQGGTSRDGYGQISIKGKKYYVHRVVNEYYYGEIPKGIDVLHKCDTPWCVNPEHQFRGLDIDNKQDSVSKGRHTFGTRIPTAVINEEIVVDMRRDYEDGLSTRKLASKYRLGKSAVHCVVSGKTWAHVS